MWKSVIYKEWLKIRWFLIGFTALGIACVGYIFLKVQHDFAFVEGKNYWYSILFQGYLFFEYLKYLPLAGALAVGIAQYFPETTNKRIKLAFHLPLKENKILLMMHGFGTACLMLSYLIFFGLFSALSAVFFPSNMISDTIISVTPMFLAGLAAYFMVALIVLEPIWKYRAFYLVVAALFISLFFDQAKLAAYLPANPILFILTAGSGIALLFSAFRFRKGEM